ncbi:MAG: 23S rRNA (uracil(1939)-C(5))-methyltransferase RlmD [Clostridia bacterium]|nr:23S rRNA (uracil(1939)-C(5))-methyltransferase RlmD [Clostridia bacterium]
MLKLNEFYNVEIESVNNLGNGVTHIDGMAVFVPYAIEGDCCVVEIEKLYSSYAIARLVSIESSSPHRTVPDCQYFGECGGCSYLNCSIEYENESKEKSVKDSLVKFGIDAKTEKTVCPVDEKYRNKVVLYHARDGFGYYKQGTNQVAHHSYCKMNCETIDMIAEFCNRTLNKSGLRALFVRKNSISPSEYMVCPIYNGKTDMLRFSIALVNTFPSVRSVLLGINREKDLVLEKTEFSTVFGDGCIEDEMCGLRFRISPKSFYQINHTCASLLYEKAIELLDAKITDTVADLFCGTGTMGMIVAKRTGAKVIGVEIEKSAVKDAKANAKLNGIKNIEFFADDAKNFDKNIDSCIIDPPRKGCSRFMIDTLLRLKPKRIVYVSCNPDTMARDVKLLSEEYKISSPVSVFNMFPRTAHVECVVCLARKTN